MILRAPRSGDIAALARLGHDSFVAKFGHLYRTEDLAPFLAEAFTVEAIAREMADRDRLYCLAEQDGALAGYCKLGLVCGWPQHARGDCVIELKQLYTDPALTGQGIGAKLMEWALAQALSRGADEMQLSVWSGNFDAQRFYARYGFEKVADVHFMVGTQRDEEFLLARTFQGTAVPVAAQRD
jgi:ribosomal protein S18 acetylase RimI-like enzyme